jgi:HlyD family secretion protein
MDRKKAGALIGVVAAVAVLGGAGFYFRDAIAGALPFLGGSSSEDKVYVEKVSRVMASYSGVSNRYNGIVESQETYEVNVDSSRKIADIKVEVGDEVTEGQVLVTYDVSDIDMQIKQANLEIESINNEIENYNEQIKQLNEQLAKAAEADKFDLNMQIKSVQNSIAQKGYDLQSKNLEISKYKTELGNNSVTSKVSGVVREINEDGVDSNGNSAAFMTIQQTGEYRVKGSIDEQNVWTISEGTPVIIRSRVDNTTTWSGSISDIDTENPDEGNNNYYYDSGDPATKYPFYIALDSADGLILGQHVYIEMDEGQDDTKEGLWLYSYYIVQQDDGTAYVWAANDRERLEKRYVTLGDYDENLDEYEITAGLDATDYITWPMDGLYEGVKTVTSADEVDYSSPLYNQEPDDVYDDGGYDEDGMYDEGYDEDGMYDEGYDEDGMYDEGYDEDGMYGEDYDMYDDGEYDDTSMENDTESAMSEMMR